MARRGEFSLGELKYGEERYGEGRAEGRLDVEN